MAGFLQLVLTYIIGGVTFIPFVFGVILCHAIFFLPQKAPPSRSRRNSLVQDGEESSDPILDEKLHAGSHEPSVASGYFAVTREYVPGGVNGKPPARTSPAGETIAAESPSVYQSMYRSIFDRNKTQSPSIEAGKVVKKARNVFFVVLRHGHLLLFDNSDQIEVRHVVSLENYSVDIYGGGDDLVPEGELWIKRNCIRLSKKPTSPAQKKPSSSPYFFFSENCSEKEDFYHALLFNQRQTPNNETNDIPAVQPFETEDMIKLIRQLHVSDDSVHTRWINSLIGRIFLALYKTSEVEEYVRAKLTKKLARASKPNFITSLRLDEIDIGHSAPIFSNPKLKSLTVDGDLTLEIDVKYTGKFKVVVSAIARLELGSRFKAREVSLILACIFKKVEGRLLVRIKPPPSNRVWVSFEAMPKLDISVEPVVSSRQITYGVVLRAIESKIREIMSDSIVYPNWDDSPFLHTETKNYRGGVWMREEQSKPVAEPDLMTVNDSGLPEPKQATTPKSVQDVAEVEQDVAENASISDLLETPTRARSFPVDIPNESPASADTASLSGSPSRFTFPEKPKAMRTHSFATAATPIVSKGPATIDAMKRPRPKKSHQDAASTMKVLSNRSQEPSPTVSPVGSPPTSSSDHKRRASSATSISGFPQLDANYNRPENEGDGIFDPPHLDSPRAEGKGHDAESILSRSSTSMSTKSFRSSNIEEKKAAVNQSISSATAAAKAWGIGVWNRQHERKKSGNEPMGRGRPLPPPGQPLPGPSTWSSAGAALTSLRRKPVPTRSSAQDIGFADAKDDIEAETSTDPEAAIMPAEDTQQLTEPPHDVQIASSVMSSDDVQAVPTEQEEPEELTSEKEPSTEEIPASEIEEQSHIEARRAAEDESLDFLTFEEEEKLWDPEAMSASG